MRGRILARIAAAVLAFAVALLVLRTRWEGLPPELTLFSSAAVGVLVYVAYGTVERLRRLYRKR